MKKGLIGILAVATIGASSFNMQQNVEAKTTASSVTTNSKETKYLKSQSGLKSFVKSTSIVDGVLTIHVKSIADFKGLMGAVNARRVSEIIGYASKTSLADKGVAIVQREQYMDGSGNKKILMDFAVYYNKAKIDETDFKNYPKVVQHTPKQLFSNANGYYMQKDFSKSTIKGMDQMRLDDDNLMTDFMDKFGA